MKNRNKRGFTIVELVIVIAIIGVLSAILIPTFSGLLKSANEAADIQMVKNLNTALATDAAVNGKHETAYDAIQVANGTGYSVEKLTPTSLNHDIVWDRKNDRFILVGENGEYKYYDQATEPSEDKREMWKIYKLEKILKEKDGQTIISTNEEYSIYLTGKNTIDSITVSGVGLDVGENTGITNVTYNSSEKGAEVAIRTNGQNLITDDSNSTVHHYGWLNELKVTNAKSYHEYGHVVILNEDILCEFVAHEGASFHQNEDIIKNKIKADVTGLDRCIFGEKNYAGEVCKFCGDDLTKGKINVSEKGIIERVDPSYATGYIKIDSHIGKVSVTAIGDSAFAGCNLLTGVELPEGITTIGKNAFENCTDLQNVSLPKNMTTIGNNAFLECKSLKNVKINGDIDSIEEGAFAECTSLKKVEINGGVNYIRYGAFGNCENLNELVIGGSVKSIDFGAFANCTSLTSVVINVEKIDECAFFGCTSLTSIILQNTEITIEETAFNDCNDFTIYYSGTVTDWSEKVSGGGKEILLSKVKYYSKTNPKETPSNYWHYNEEGVPTLWG